MKEYKYKAFISYRHTEPDMQAAEKLQKLLEAYKPPKQFAGKKEHWRIFRDVSELQSSSDLSEDIRNAIENSEFLIIICSPAYNESKWCRQELMHFRELHGNTNDNIITLLVGGEPDKAFPELLRFIDTKTVDENGKETTVKVEVEPLAANISAETLKESMKKLNTEYLRIAAPLIGCDFNDLYQREKKRAAQRRMRILASAFAVLSVITVISAVSAITIKKKNSEIEDKNDKIEEQFNKIEEQYSALVVENAEHLAAESEVLYNNSSLIPAIRKAVEALPSSDGEKPAIPEAQYALSKEMGLFNAENIFPRYALKHDYAIEKLSYMGGGKGIVSQDSSGIYFWNADDGSLIKKITPADKEFASPVSSDSSYLSAMIEPDTDKTGMSIKQFGSRTKNVTSTVFDYVTDSHAHAVTDNEPGTGGDVFVNNACGTVWRLSGADGETLWKNELDPKKSTFKKLTNDGENLLRLYSVQSDMAADRIMLDIIDPADGKIKSTTDVTSLGGNSMTFDSTVEIKAFRDNTIYAFRDYLAETDPNVIAAYEIKDGKPEKKWEYSIADGSKASLNKPSFYFFNGDPVVIVSRSSMSHAATNVIRLNKENGEAVWNTGLQSKFSQNGRPFLYEAKELGSGDDVLAIVDEMYYSIIGYSDGKVIDTVNLDKKINSISFSRSGFFTFTVKNGEEYAINLKAYFGNDPQRIALRIQRFGQPFALCSYSRGRYVTAAESASTAYIQFTEKTGSYTGIAPDDEQVCTGAYAASSDGSIALAGFSEINSSDDTIYICDTANGKFTRVEGVNGLSLKWAHFLTNDKIAAAVSAADAKTKLYFIDTATGSLTGIEDAGNIDEQFGVVGDSIYFFEHSSDLTLKKLSPDGTVSSLKIENSKEYIHNKHCAVGDKIAVIISESTDSKLEFCDFSSGSCTAAERTFGQSNGDQILSVFRINDNTAGVLLNSKTVLAFDTETGKLISELKPDSVNQEFVSAAGIGNDRFIVLSRDAKLYEADMNGFTGKIIDLSGPAVDQDTVSALTDCLRVCPSADSDCFCAVWDDHSAWYIDAAEFKIRYAFDKFAFAPSGKDIVFTYDDFYGRFGYFPIYTVQQLVDTAGSYLEALGEAPEGN